MLTLKFWFSFNHSFIRSINQSINSFCFCRSIRWNILSNSLGLLLSFSQSGFLPHQSNFLPISLQQLQEITWILLGNILRSILRHFEPFTHLCRLQLKPCLQVFYGWLSFILLLKANRKYFLKQLLERYCFQVLQTVSRSLLILDFGSFKQMKGCLRLTNPR